MANLNVNKSILGGRITADPELKQTPSGVSVTAFSIAVARRKGKDGKQITDFINCVAWRQTAEFICKYFRKGASIFVVGEIQVRTWNDQNGQKRYATEVIVSEAHFVDSKTDTNANDASVQIPDAAPIPPNFEEISTDEDLPF